MNDLEQRIAQELSDYILATHGIRPHAVQKADGEWSVTFLPDGFPISTVLGKKMNHWKSYISGPAFGRTANEAKRYARHSRSEGASLYLADYMQVVQIQVLINSESPQERVRWLRKLVEEIRRLAPVICPNEEV
jgi:hypothetical protein